MFFHIGIVIKGSDLASGLRFNNLGLGGSVARARAASVSWNKLIHISCTAVRIDCSPEFEIAEITVIRTDVIVTVIWNWLVGSGMT